MGQAAAPLAIASSLLGASQTLSAGKIAESEAKLQARQVELGATQREGDRKERLAEALASQNASAGARGIAAFQGSPLTILEADIAREETATERDQFASNLEALTLRSKGAFAKSQARFNAVTGLLKSGSQFASVAG